MIRTLLILLILAGCATTSDVAVVHDTTEVKSPLPTPCVPKDKYPTPPMYPKVLEKGPVDKNTALLIQYSLDAKEYVARADALITACLQP